METIGNMLKNGQTDRHRQGAIVNLAFYFHFHINSQYDYALLLTPTVMHTAIY